MRLGNDEALRRLVAHDHAVLSTQSEDRGADLVPVVYAVEDDWLGVPVDRVKAKRSTRLQRVANLERDPRATLLIEHWDRDDWSRLWWVRADLVWEPEAPPGREVSLAGRLVDRYPQYGDGSFERVLLFRLRSLYGWAAGE